ncbi:endonuclease NucS, partial [Candidatus Bathyarchaeota archaeon]|nr:endonuclease NucS [Candidatus Bathyarchaeota archaeon]
KRVKAGKSAVLQLAKYVEEMKYSAGENVRGVLAAPQLSKGTQRLLATLNLEFKKIDLEECAQVMERKKERKIRDFI